MKPALLNSIYNDQNQSSGNLKDLVDLYTKKVHIFYLDVLDKAGVKNLDQKIKVTTKFPDGYTLTDTFKAGHHLIDYLFHSNQYKEEIKRLDRMFLENCKCPEKEDVLDRLKYIISEEGSENLDVKDWIKAAEDIANCESY